MHITLSSKASTVALKNKQYRYILKKGGREKKAIATNLLFFYPLVETATQSSHHLSKNQPVPEGFPHRLLG